MNAGLRKKKKHFCTADILAECEMCWEFLREGYGESYLPRLI